MISQGPGQPTINHCEIPPWIIASDEFNLAPVPLSIAGVRESNVHLFRRLEGIPDPMERGQVFHDYVSVKFALHQWENYHGKARSSLRNSYIRFLRGWGVDSNGIEGAVLKSWVQSRFGILPTYHRGVLRPLDGGEEDHRFALDRMRGSAKTNCIFSQLDLLYEFCQYELARRWPEREVLTLYRGTFDPEEHPVFETRARRESCVRLNNLISFTDDRERAWEFGSTVWQATVAAAKVVFFSQLLPSQLLKGEDEYLVVGGNYWVRELLY
ncbi:NAD(+)--dinitrogen-reductase ADP-D-ribosyltransferase [Ruficoccus amylovorans]|uniref:NAD(+)--dinitrogen-reductase ADP-D-ribosyltransferase n=1 Tax=Ruficoccus amylovorans TaxID=1804625 RepID=A0A842HA10_9BACT|nr:NAD(+)--dinitrogen-reductase ADP-D-ribosyltransferase [Ruficoccus amylovorans]MBC2592938.1 NAD(+)--dinitrogen-reductase ADP-D-ribosyltransferase [Ruficoccus amylovorans]